ncbi:WSC domain-containing protein, partial [Mycena maculata]
YSDQASARVLTGPSTVDRSGMTVERCTAFCRSFQYAGVEYARECFCGTAMQVTNVTSADECNMPCSGNASQTCGAGNRLAAYVNEPLMQPASIPPSVGKGGRWTYNRLDSVSSRTLNASASVVGGMTEEKSTAACQAKGFSYTRTEYARRMPSSFPFVLTRSYTFPSECWCGSTLTSALSAKCDMRCTGNSTQLCGGGDFSQFTATPIPGTPPRQVSGSRKYQRSDNPNRILNTNVTVDVGMTAEKCTGACQAKGFSCAGTEYAKGCGNSMTSTPVTGADCNMPCTGNSTQICGGGNHISVTASVATPLPVEN